MMKDMIEPDKLQLKHILYIKPEYDALLHHTGCSGHYAEAWTPLHISPPSQETLFHFRCPEL